jgi:predicted DCC family thiol-disulfide oxidoreductase YuxK
MTEHGPILLFDGVCKLCNRLVIFIIKRDRNAKIRFAPLQSPSGIAILKKTGLSVYEINSIVFIEGESFFLMSSAVLHIFKTLGGGWRLFYGFIIIPKFIRDYFYNIIARH